MRKFVDPFITPTTEKETLLKEFLGKYESYKPGDQVFWIEKENSYELVECICKDGLLILGIPNEKDHKVTCPVCKGKRENMCLPKPVIVSGKIKNINFSGDYISGIVCISDNVEAIEYSGSWILSLKYVVLTEEDKIIDLFHEDIFPSREAAQETYDKELKLYNKTLKRWKNCLSLCNIFETCDARDIKTCVCAKCKYFMNCEHNEISCEKNFYNYDQ